MTASSFAALRAVVAGERTAQESCPARALTARQVADAFNPRGDMTARAEVTASEGRRVLPAEERCALLLAAVLAEGGEWTPDTVRRLYWRERVSSTFKATIRADLKALHAAGHLDVHEGVGRRYYTAAGGAK